MNKLNQKRYKCPKCEKPMAIDQTDTINGTHNAVYCINLSCDYEGVAWDVAKLESFDINKQQRVWDLLEDDDE